MPYTSCDLCTYRVWGYYGKMFRKRRIYKKIQYQYFAQYQLHHVSNPATKFEVATSNLLGGDTFTRKWMIWSLTLTFWSRSHEMLPSTLYIMWPIQLQSLKLLRKGFKRRCIYKKIQYLTSDLDLGVKVTRNVAQYPLHHVIYSATMF